MCSLMNSPTQTSAWTRLATLSEDLQDEDFRISHLFDESANRFERFSLAHDSLLLDYSKNFLTDESLATLIDLARECHLPAAIEAMFGGEKINRSEDRAVLHVALRDPDTPKQEVLDTLARMETLVEAINSGEWKGYSGKRIANVVNIGIGGSDLGPALVSDALSAFSSGSVDVHFVSNVDPVHLRNTLSSLNPETTLFIIASKSFTTLETHQNGKAARQWLLNSAQNEEAIARHFIAVTTNESAATEFGILGDKLLPLWDWVGGRYSLWSAIGLPIALAIGMDNFRALLAGAHAMDRHFQEADLEENMPVLMALVSVFYNGFFDCHSTAVVPYSQQLNRLPAYLQQLCMESLGKAVDIQGRQVATNSGEVIWGTPGTNGQHSYFQLLHQGTQFVPVDFIAFANAATVGDEEQHRHLLANCFAQSLALMNGHTVAHEPHKHVPGNRPSNTLLIEALNPYNLGSLIALYEHKVFVQSVIWNINAFDQWGVQLGKLLSGRLFDALSGEAPTQDFDASTRGLIDLARKWNGRK